MKRLLIFAALFTFFLAPVVNSGTMPERIPPFSLQDTEGNSHTLQDYQGKILMVFTLGYG